MRNVRCRETVVNNNLYRIRGIANCMTWWQRCNNRWRALFINSLQGCRDNIVLLNAYIHVVLPGSLWLANVNNVLFLTVWQRSVCMVAVSAKCVCFEYFLFSWVLFFYFKYLCMQAELVALLCCWLCCFCCCFPYLPFHSWTCISN